MSPNTNDYWTKFWTEHGRAAEQLDEQSQVFRTLNKQPIDDSIWRQTVDYILGQFRLLPNQHVLDLAGGNGLLAREFVKQVEQVTVVDVSSSLLEQSNQIERVKTVCSDFRCVNFHDELFDNVLFYAGLQYLTQLETIGLLKRIRRWLKPGGCIFIGDIPDVERRWDFFDSRKRKSQYFQALESGCPIVGTWFERDWLAELLPAIGFNNVEVLNQPKTQIYSWFRFDMRCEK